MVAPAPALPRCTVHGVRCPGIGIPDTGHRTPDTAKGFSLIELIVVVTIIGLLAGIAMVNVRNSQRRAREEVLRMNLAQLRKAIDDFYADKQRFPSSINELVEAHYMRAIPKDPITQAADWIEEADDSDPDSLGGPLPGGDTESLGPGIADVKSAAEGETLDGTPYGDL